MPRWAGHGRAAVRRAIGTLHGDGEVRAVLEPPDGIAAYLWLPLRRSQST